MSLYGQAISSSINMLSGAEADQIYDATYNQVYAAEAQKANIRNAMHAAQLNIAALEQDKVLTNTKIRMQQDEAEAAAKVSAATAGVEGGSLQDILYETESNAAMARNSVSKQADQAIESQLATIGSQTSALLAVNDDLPDISYVDDLLGAFSSFELGDLEVSDALDSEGISLDALWSG